MQEKTIKEIVNEFKSDFGDLDFEAVNDETGQVVKSKNFIKTSHKHEIDGGDFLALGGSPKHQMNKGALEGILNLHFRKKQ